MHECWSFFRRVRTPKLGGGLYFNLHFIKKIPEALEGQFNGIDPPNLVTPVGFKPTTAGAEIQCAIQLRHEAFF